MRNLLTAICLTIPFFIAAQTISYQQYQKEARINKRLLPKYGLVEKSEDEIAADEAFKEKSIEEYTSARMASKKMVELGYRSLPENPKKAMYHFNQAYLLDSSNANIYWGYGSLYSHFEKYALAAKYFNEGLLMDPKNTMLLNALAACYHQEYLSGKGDTSLQKGITLLKRSFRIDPGQLETSRLLTKSYLELEDCERARKYYQVYLNNSNQEGDFDLMQRIEEECESNQ